MYLTKIIYNRMYINYRFNVCEESKVCHKYRDLNTVPHKCGAGYMYTQGGFYPAIARQLLHKIKYCCAYIYCTFLETY